MTTATLIARTGSSERNIQPQKIGSDDSIERERMKRWLNERIAASQKEPITEIVTLTPVLAQLLLERNPDNRPLSPTQLERIERDLKSNRWEFNGETIVVAKNGELNNGQHRCHAVVRSGTALRVILVFGTERQSRMTIDTGITRTVGHFLGMNGYSDVNVLAAAISNLWQYRSMGRLSNTGKDKPTKSESLMTIEHYSDMPESVLFAGRKGTVKVASRSLIAFAHYVLGHAIGNPGAETFLNKLIDGTELRKDDPILYARNRLIEMKGVTRVHDKAELIFRAWNMHRRGERATRIPLLGRLPEIER